MKKIALIAVTMVLIFSLSACNNQSTDTSVEKIGEIIMTGSSTLGPVVTQLISEFTDKYSTWDQVNSEFPKEPISIVINGGGSGAGIKSAIDKSANFGLASKSVSEEEQAKFEKYQQFKLGTDALTIAVNPNNNVYNLQEGFTTEQLKKIFSGEYKLWSDVNKDLPKEEIVVITRDIGGGAHSVFQKKIMGDAEVSANVIQSPSMGALVTKIIDNENAIGYASFGVVNQNSGKLIAMNVDEVEPSKENIISGDYKISRPLLVLKNGELKQQEQAFIDFLISERGMQVVTELGFVSAK
ncbi:phosphate ABC transporter substrate-binding protein [Clostridium sp. 'deep sea']|uniref:phosphate ABC transporter substrate-binding protein n=1 Tax=Clostridium sp. 'deep sea' TaxID=2779445 RepID=UPI0018967CF6|nr:phosphate ABC transporter substrate-binding protein [Clostridium sp. 'deep sea']QOR35133.1 phosphate ABC transporter substrate-binding protein [Clostridium sp. 'deep sea']